MDMGNNEIIKNLETIFLDVFELDSITLSDNTSADDIEEWDSINHIRIVGEIQKLFGIRINAREMMSWESVGDIVNTIYNKVNGK